MPKEIDRNQLNQTLLHINWLIRDRCAESRGQYLQKGSAPWNEETERRWAELYARLLTMLQSEDFSDVLNTLNEELERLRHGPK